MRSCSKSMGVKAGALAAALVAFARPALAHSGFPSVGDFWNGALHPILDTVQTITLLGIGLCLAREESPGGRSLFNHFHIGFGAGLIAGMLIFPPETETVAPPALAALGLTMINPKASVGAHPVFILTTISILAGLSFGAAIPKETTKLVFGCGLAFAAILLPVYSAAFWERFQRPWFGVGMRIAGSWLVAIAMMLFGASLR